MGSPDAPGQGEPPYRPWPGEQLPYTPSTAASADAFTEPVPRPRRGRRRLRVTALLLAAVGISAGAVFFTRSDDPGPADDGGATGGLTVDPTDDPTDGTSPTEEESSTTEPVEPPTEEAGQRCSSGWQPRVHDGCEFVLAVEDVPVHADGLRRTDVLLAVVDEVPGSEPYPTKIM